MRKWILYGLGGLVVIVLSVVAYVLATGLRTSHPVGFQLVSVGDPKGPPLKVGVWYPANASPRLMLLGMILQYVASDAPVTGEKLPLVVISHGIAGSMASHADTALALANAGFVVAAPLHTGDNYADQHEIGRPNWFADRSRHVHLTIDYLLKSWRDHGRIDADRIGIFGFSAGGTTALIAIGGEPDAASIESHCAKAPEFACQLFRSKKAALPSPDAFVRDPRIKAAVIIAPGAGFAFVPDGLMDVNVPVQLWNGAIDRSVPLDTNAKPVREALGSKAEFHLVPNAGHFAFMIPCGPFGPAVLCKDAAGFDRKTFHEAFNVEVVAFFKTNLAAAPHFVCATMANYFCFPYNYSPAVQIQTDAGTYDVDGQRAGFAPEPDKSLGVKIDVTLPDFVPELSRDGMNLSCSKTWCIFYHKYCSKNKNLRSCSYVQSIPVRNDGARDSQRIIWRYVFYVTAQSDAAFKQTEEDVILQTNGDSISAKEFISLQQLEHASDESEVTSCDTRVQTKGCQKPKLQN